MSATQPLHPVQEPSIESRHGICMMAIAVADALFLTGCKGGGRAESPYTPLGNPTATLQKPKG